MTSDAKNETKLVKVMDKFCIQAGREKLQELLGIDKSSTSFLLDQEKEKVFLKQM